MGAANQTIRQCLLIDLQNEPHTQSSPAVCFRILVFVPNWFFDNFWAKADFYDSIPFTVPFVAYSLVAATLGTLACEGAIGFVKKYL